MTELIETKSPDGVLVPSDAGTPSAFLGDSAAPTGADLPDMLVLNEGGPDAGRFLYRTHEVGSNGAVTVAYNGLAARAGLEQLKEGAVDYYERGKDQIESFEESLRRKVKTEPLKSVLVAAAVGLVVGFIWKRR